MEYVESGSGSGSGSTGKIVEGAVDEADALKKLKEDPNKFKRPVVCISSIADPTPSKQARLTSNQIVDWNNGRASEHSHFPRLKVRKLTYHAVAGDNESEIMKLIRQLPKETDSV